jgi:hypothetical protein
MYQENSMRMTTIAAASIMLALSGAAFAQADGHYRTSSDRDQECWNSGAGHYEGVRKGERQNDLDFSRCHFTRSASGSAASECWNSRAGHFESVRPGERQDDLDFKNCREVDEHRKN